MVFVDCSSLFYKYRSKEMEKFYPVERRIWFSIRTRLKMDSILCSGSVKESNLFE